MSSSKVHFESIEFKISILFDKFQHLRSQNIYIQFKILCTEIVFFIVKLLKHNKILFSFYFLISNILKPT